METTAHDPETQAVPETTSTANSIDFEGLPMESLEAQALREEVARFAAREEAALLQFRTALLATEPAMDSALVSGETFESVHASFVAARASLARVRESLRSELSARVPAGAPGRSRPQPRTALQKIRDGLSRD